MKKTTSRIFVAVLGFLILASVSGCTKDPYMLGVMGYNYTDRAIADFSVNGQWGANVVLSTPTSGGGSTMCCVVMSRSTKAPFWIDIVYKMDALETYSPRKKLESAGPYIKTRVKVEGPIPLDPGYLEIHFYQDHIEAAVTGQVAPSPPRLRLQSRSGFAR